MNEHYEEMRRVLRGRCAVQVEVTFYDLDGGGDPVVVPRTLEFEAGTPGEEQLEVFKRITAELNTVFGSVAL